VIERILSSRIVTGGFGTKISYTTVILKVESVKTIELLSSRLFHFAETLPTIIDGIYILRNK
jgi:hypothetical protein